MCVTVTTMAVTSCFCTTFPPQSNPFGKYQRREIYRQDYLAGVKYNTCNTPHTNKHKHIQCAEAKLEIS